MESTVYTFIGTKIRLKPTKNQKILLWKSAGWFRDSYITGLWIKQIDNNKKGNKFINDKVLRREMTKLKKKRL